jgi:hypothetical protein
VESGDTLYRGDGTAIPLLADRYRRSGYDRTSVTLDRRVGALGLWFGGSRLAERDSLLGARFGAALGAPHATSWFIDAAARFDAGGGWSLGGSLRQGWSYGALRFGVDGRAMVRTSAFSADLSKYGVFDRTDQLALRIAQPLRVSTGGLSLNLPTDFDYTTMSVSQWTVQRLNLAPTGRELDMEAAYSRAFGPGNVQTNLFYRRDPGNFARLPDDYGMALRYSYGF